MVWVSLGICEQLQPDPWKVTKTCQSIINKLQYGPRFHWKYLVSSQVIKTWKATALEGTSGIRALTCFMSIPQLPTDRINTKHFSCTFPASAWNPQSPSGSTAPWFGKVSVCWLKQGKLLAVFSCSFLSQVFTFQPQFVS